MTHSGVFRTSNFTASRTEVSVIDFSHVSALEKNISIYTEIFHCHARYYRRYKMFFRGVVEFNDNYFFLFGCLLATMAINIDCICILYIYIICNQF